jgi:hypothetical protein
MERQRRKSQNKNSINLRTTHISVCSAANTISIIIGNGTAIVEVDGVGVVESGIIGIGCACTCRKFDHSSMTDAAIHPIFMVER